MSVFDVGLPGVLGFQPAIFRDHRGYFMETWNLQRMQESGFAETFVQDNVAYSNKGVLRGLHYQHPNGQGKLVTVLQGRVFDVMVDIRQGSATFGRWRGITLDSHEPTLLYIPPGYAHGYVALSEPALFQYKVTQFYDAAGDRSILWNDPDIGVEWPIYEPILSIKDKEAPRLRDVDSAKLPAL